ncbi:MAG TPA: ABC-F family ATP-binding cassette domain-containing protein [Rhizomicrobium sp.]|nr:ABC-F family ATP-binding cassette domain-containing protein [Rhizomicrobium sp.]
MLVIDNITYRIAGREILSGASAQLPTARRVGLVGRNGAGKTTLLKLIMGQLHADGGEISLPSGARMGAVAQEAPASQVSLLDTVLEADTERTTLLTESETATDPHRIGDIHSRLEAIDAWSAPARAAAILSGLGFSPEDQLRPCAEFSGGWRMRVALAAILFSAPDLLLLDEPTNYLDLEGVLWLEDFLKRYRGTVLIVSHDRDLLNTAAEFILHLDKGKLLLYTGGYDKFSEARTAKKMLDASFAKKQDATRKHLQSFVDRFRAKASKARQAQSRIKMLEKLGPVSIALDEHVAPIRIPQPTEANPPLITMDRASTGYETGKTILSGLSMRIDPDDRIALLGKNGNGKSTLAKLLVGKLESTGGDLVRAKKLIPGYFAQHQLDELDGSVTPLVTLSRVRPKLNETQLRTQLAGFGFSSDKVKTDVAKLSGGERARLMLALATLDKPNLLILDEPTNHLDIDARNELMKALNDFEGAVILVSHDRRLIESTADTLLLVADGTVKPFDGDLDDYKTFLLSGDGRRPGSTKEDKPSKAARRADADRRKALKPLKERVETEEKQIEVLSVEIKKYDATLADPLLFVQDVNKANAVSKKRADAMRKLKAVEERWMKANEDYEAAQAE